MSATDAYIDRATAGNGSKPSCLKFGCLVPPSGGDAALVAQRAGLEPIRVAEAISSREVEK
jgi:hypothetical protein